MRYELKPLGVGGILDQTILIFKDRFGLFLLIVLCVRVPTSAVFNYLIYANQLAMPLQPTDAQASEFFQKLGQLYLTVLLPSILINVFLVGPITDAASIYAAARVYLGQPTTLGESFRAALSRYFPYVVASILWSLMLFVGSLCCVLPGILLAFRFALVLPVVVLERLSGFAAFERSRILMHFDTMRNYVTLFLLGCGVIGVQIGISSGAGLIGQAHLQALLTALLQSLASAFATIALVVFYFSCRCRAEGFDLIHLARVVAETPADQPDVASQD
jgi:hypothetical protein